MIYLLNGDLRQVADDVSQLSWERATWMSKFLADWSDCFSNERCEGKRPRVWRGTHEVEMPRCQAAVPPLLSLRGASLAEAER